MKNNGVINRSIAILMGAFVIAAMMGCTADVSIGDEAAGSAEAVENQQDTKENAEAEDNKELHSTVDISEASLINDGKLTVGMVIDYPPFEYYPPNMDTPIGVDVDIVNAVAKELGLTPEIKNVPWDDNLFKNMGSEYDVVCSAVSVTEERLESMIFSDSYMDNYQSVVVRKDSGLTVAGFDDLSGLKVAVQKDTVSDELMLGYAEDSSIDVELIENEVATDCFEQLINGEVDAVVCDSTLADGQTSRHADVLEEAYRDEESVEKFAIAISKDNEGLKRAINEALKKLREDGIEKTIIDSWFTK